MLRRGLRVSLTTPGYSETSLEPVSRLPLLGATQESGAVICCHLVAGMGTLRSISIPGHLNQENALSTYCVPAPQSTPAHPGADELHRHGPCPLGAHSLPEETLNDPQINTVNEYK